MGKKVAQMPRVSFQIGKCTIGGRPGEYPTTLLLSIFHQGDKLVSDHKLGRFDKARAIRYINRANKLSNTTGNPVILDVLAETPKAMEQYLSFLDEVAEDTPFLIDSSSSVTRLAGISHCANTGRAPLAIYDSINSLTSSEELELLRTAKIEAAILLAYNPTDIHPKGRLDILKGSSQHEGLLAKAKRANITKILVDTAALDLAGLSLAAAAFPYVTRELGLPVGAGSANSIAIWRHAAKLSPAAKRYLAPALCTYLQCCGANFILPGSLRRAPRFFTTTAVTDALLAYASPEGTYPPAPPSTRQHPRYTIL